MLGVAVSSIALGLTGIAYGQDLPSVTIGLRPVHESASKRMIDLIVDLAVWCASVLDACNFDAIQD
jgi:hypothetical protein